MSQDKATCFELLFFQEQNKCLRQKIQNYIKCTSQFYTVVFAVIQAVKLSWLELKCNISMHKEMFLEVM